MEKFRDYKTVAVFDFDGTITHKNSTLPFLKFLSGDEFNWKFLKKIPKAIAYQLRMIDVDQLNTAIAEGFLKNLSRDFLFRNGAEFAELIIPKLIRDSAFSRLNWHKKQGHHCILATSAYNIYVDYWAKTSGFDDIASTKIQFDDNEQATGRLEGKSCNGREKLRRVLELVRHPEIVYAYGDSYGDKELLAYATYPYYRRFR
ncbi:HAD-IB family hydrolase [Legionella jordanis]|uniref:Haloacid dehalogenase-like hydrolase n=1 Tax=Legionella jordanis TaxID=456 RepID=A0A0W0VFU8_9GAMM|nr:HAD-IB family hydrolase [Legionella jordanis]KTD19012.1 haloacid dehalogenase-like hydrolase [Legionella jordanis]RMX05427.1 HAD-IB family hydrolase [Legionella jordanis]VEH13114.1 HAD hydrolase, family IB [Legionella jordanis]HAT8714775.1 HAD-IB family hydrolase [Legionella jordanis]